MKFIIAAVVAGMLLPNICAGADEKKLKLTPVTPMLSVAGAESFKEYCASCHGLSGKGDGPAAVALKVAPRDLGTLTQRHTGKYPTDWLLSILNGKAKIAVHGTSDMPVWGPVFRSFESDAATRLRIFNLVEHIKTLQK